MSSRDSKATRHAILGAARKLFERDGFHAVGLEAIARAAGVSRQAIYLHFKSKRSLLIGVVDQLQEELITPAFERVGVWSAASGVEALERWIDVAAMTTDAIMGVANAYDVARRTDPEVLAAWQIPVRSRFRGCVRIARWIQHDGMLAPGWTIRDAAAMIWALTMIRLYEDLTIELGWSPRRYAARTKQFLRAALTTGSVAPVGEGDPRRRPEPRRSSRARPSDTSTPGA